MLAPGAVGDVAVWTLTGPVFAGAIADPIEAWLRCGPAAARDTIVAGVPVVRDGVLVSDRVDEMLAAHRDHSARIQRLDRDVVMGVMADVTGNAGFPDRFRLGCNYWPRNKAMSWWSDFDAGEVGRRVRRDRRARDGLRATVPVVGRLDADPLDEVSTRCVRDLGTVCDAATVRASSSTSRSSPGT